MFCKNCGTQQKEEIKFCLNCGKENAISHVEIKEEQKIDNKIPWYRNLKWQHLLLISLVSLIIYLATGGYIWDFLFLIALIFAIITFVKSRKKK